MGSEVFFQVCRECVSKNPSCCKGNSVPLTIGDIDRITGLGHDPRDFVVAGEYGRKFVEGFESWWVESFVAHGDYLYKLNTRTRDDGSCVFLVDGTGCTLGENRPAVCRLYPFWLSEDGETVYEPEEVDSCLIPRKGLSLDEGLRSVNEDPETVRGYFQEIRSDCENNHDRHERIIAWLLGLSGQEEESAAFGLGSGLN